jgi:Protein of unknown function (DUF742)
MSFHDSYHDRPVRPYVVTRGRVRPSRNTIRPETLLIATGADKPLPVSASSEERALLRMCRRLLSLVEAAVHLGLPVSVVSIVASDLVDAGFLAMRAGSEEPASGAAQQRPGDFMPARPDRQLLQEVLNGLRRLGETGPEGA